MSENMRNIIDKVRSTSRKVVYRTVVLKVAGFNKGESLVEFAAFNFIKIKPGKKQAYINRNKEFSTKQYKNYSNQQAWYAWERYDAKAGGLMSWNYLSMDGYNKASDKFSSTNSLRYFASDPFRRLCCFHKFCLQWMGGEGLQETLEGRLVLIHLLCKDLGRKENSLYSPCISFRVAGSPG